MPKKDGDQNMEVPREVGESRAAFERAVNSHVKEIIAALEEWRSDQSRTLDRRAQKAEAAREGLAKIEKDIAEIADLLAEEPKVLNEEDWTRLENGCVRVVDDYGEFLRRHKEAYGGHWDEIDAKAEEVAADEDFRGSADRAGQAEEWERLHADIGSLKIKKDEWLEKGKKEATDASSMAEPFLRFIEKSRLLLQEIDTRLDFSRLRQEHEDRCAADAILSGLKTEMASVVERTRADAHRGAFSRFLHRRETNELWRRLQELRGKYDERRKSLWPMPDEEEQKLRKLQEHLETVTGSDNVLKRIQSKIADAEWYEGKEMTTEDAHAVGSRERYVRGLEAMEEKEGHDARPTR